MSEKKTGIYFLGSGPIAAPILRRLAASPGFVLCGVGTQPDRAAGRKRLPTPTPCAKAARELGIEAARFPNVNAPEALEAIASTHPELILVVSFGQLLREPLLRLPRAGCVNVHASLLPRYRGASPIAGVILNGETETGVAFMAMEKGLDTGGIYALARRPLHGDERADSLELELGEIAAGLLPRVLPAIAGGTLKAIPQDAAGASCCVKIRKEDGLIDWTRSAVRIEAMTRAYAPWPGCRFTLDTESGTIELQLTAARIRHDLSGAPGTLLPGDRHGWIVACGTGALELLRVAPPGKREMSVREFLNGVRGTCTIAAPAP